MKNPFFSEFNLSEYGFVGMFNFKPIQPHPKDLVFTRTTASPATMNMRLRVISGEYVTVNGSRYDGQGDTDINISTTSNEFRIQYSTPTAITKLDLASTQVSGDLSALSNLTNINRLFLYNTQINGDISALSNLTNIVLLLLYRTQVSGDISVLSNLTNIDRVGLNNTYVTGNISVLSTLHNLNNVSLDSTQVTGLDTITSIHITSMLNLQYNTMITEQIDNILQSLVNGSNNNTNIYLQNGNEAPSSLGESAIDTLRSNGCTVTVTGGY